MIKILVLLFFTNMAIGLLSCEAQNEYLKSGVVIHGYRRIDLKTNEVSIPEYHRDWKVWYMDSLIVQEAGHVHINEDTNGVETWYSDVLYYTFIDLRTRSFYRYSSFSDTATMIKCCYTQADSVPVGGGWDFYYHPAPKKVINTLPMPDTIINNKVYKRACSSVNPSEGSSSESEVRKIYYFDCSRKNSMFTIDYNISKLADHCPLVRIDYLPYKGGSKYMNISFIDFMADSLTGNEIKVFNAWKKNMKEKPVKKAM